MKGFVTFCENRVLSAAATTQLLRQKQTELNRAHATESRLRPFNLNPKADVTLQFF